MGSHAQITGRHRRPCRAAQAVRVARAALAAQARNSYRLLEKRQEECIASLHQAELRANAALHGILIAGAKRPSRKTSRARRDDDALVRPGGQKFRQLLAESC